MTFANRPFAHIPACLAYLAVGALAVAVHAAMEPRDTRSPRRRQPLELGQGIVVGLVRQAGFEHAAVGDVAARLGGDEFGVLLTGVPDPSYAIQTADRLLATFDAPIEVAWQTTTAGASIGIALDTAGTIAVDDLLGQADIAMYRAKAQGKGRSHLFSPDDVLDNEAVARRIVDRDTSDRRGISFRKPSMGRPALGQEPG